jgi:hypothetical protein
MAVIKNQFVDTGLVGDTPPAVIEFSWAAIQTEIDSTASGKSYRWIVHDNSVTDTFGFAPSITTYFFGGDQKLYADIQRNKVDGTTTGVDILYYGPGVAEADYYIANNTFSNNDSVLVVASAPDSPFTDLKIKAEENCFINTGARNSPPLQGPPFMNGSYYGGAVIFGGADNTALQMPGNGLNGTDLGNVTFDMGYGPLNSRGRNSFINTTGADTWVEPSLTLYIRRNWFGGSAPVDAGVGGTVLFDPLLHIRPRGCDSNS